MTQDIHEQARELIALAGDLTDAQQRWLHSHLQECAACQSYANAVREVSSALRSIPFAADARLVRATQMRARFHAARLRETRDRMWLVGLACVGVGISASLTAPLAWKLFAWIGAWAGVSSPVWQAGFVLFWIVPALLVSVLLVARGTHLTHSNDRS